MGAWKQRVVFVALCAGMSYPVALLAEQSTCLTCHDAMTQGDKGRFVHKPLVSIDCSSCHQPVSGARHPGGKGSVRLLDKGARPCHQCHGSKADRKFVHAPVAAGDCTACHAPHLTPYPKLLKEKGAALCLTCHEDRFRKKFPHGPVAGGNCLFCHDPHSADNRMLLKKFGAALCFDCHDNSLAKGRYVHEPVGYGDCVACHAVHGSDYRMLLKGNFSQAFYLSYSSANYALCFNCHTSEIPVDERTGTITGFRNGDRNLHYLHINKAEKGRSCKACHDPHSAGQEMLIKERVPGFGKWDIPMFFTRTPTGGTCVVGCHKPKTYDRISAVEYR